MIKFDFNLGPCWKMVPARLVVGWLSGSDKSCIAPFPLSVYTLNVLQGCSQTFSSEVLPFPSLLLQVLNSKDRTTTTCLTLKSLMRASDWFHIVYIHMPTYAPCPWKRSYDSFGLMLSSMNCCWWKPGTNGHAEEYGLVKHTATRCSKRFIRFMHIGLTKGRRLSVSI